MKDMIEDYQEYLDSSAVTEAEYQEQGLPEYYADEEDWIQEMLWEDWINYQETLESLRYEW